MSRSDLFTQWQQFFTIDNSSIDSHAPLVPSLILNTYWASPSSLPVARFLPGIIMMSYRFLFSTLFASSVLLSPSFAQTVTSQTVSSTAFPTSTGVRNTTATTTSVASTNTAPDVYLNVPTLSVGRIELDVDNLQADINLNAQVANLVTINAGVKVGITKVNITIADIDAELELVVRLNNLVAIVNRVFQSLDLNPLLLSVVNATTEILGDVVGAVDGLLGSITQGGSTLNFLVDNLGNIVQEVTNTANETVSSIVGNYLTNMTLTGATQDLGNGLTQKTYSYSPLNSLVNIVFNTLGQVVQATVQGATGTSTSSAAATSTAAARRMR